MQLPWPLMQLMDMASWQTPCYGRRKRNLNAARGVAYGSANSDSRTITMNPGMGHCIAIAG